MRRTRNVLQASKANELPALVLATQDGEEAEIVPPVRSCKVACGDENLILPIAIEVDDPPVFLRNVPPKLEKARLYPIAPVHRVLGLHVRRLGIVCRQEARADLRCDLAQRVGFLHAGAIEVLARQDVPIGHLARADGRVERDEEIPGGFEPCETLWGYVTRGGQDQLGVPPIPFVPREHARNRLVHQGEAAGLHQPFELRGRLSAYGEVLLARQLSRVQDREQVAQRSARPSGRFGASARTEGEQRTDRYRLRGHDLNIRPSVATARAHTCGACRATN